MNKQGTVVLNNGILWYDAYTGYNKLDSSSDQNAMKRGSTMRQ